MCSTPLGSPTVSQKRPYVHVPVDEGWCRSGYGTGWVYRVGTRVVHTGWVYRVGNTGYTGYPASSKDVHRQAPCRQRSGPRKPKGLEWVVCRVRPVRPSTHPPPLQARWAFRARSAGDGFPPRANAASWPIRRDSASFLRNLVKTA